MRGTNIPPAVLVTGGAHRLGACIARKFAQAGWRVVLHYRRSTTKAEALAAELGNARTFAGDLSDPATVAAMAGQLSEQEPGLACIINNASLFEWDSPGSLDPDVFTRAMATNAAAPVLLTERLFAGIPAMRVAINLLDQKIANPNPDFLSYSMSKHALFAATRLMAMHFADSGKRVYGLAPGAMLPSHDQALEEHDISGRMNLLTRLTEPDELAEAALFLAEARLASGQVLFVDSGQHLLSQARDVLFLARA